MYVAVHSYSPQSKGEIALTKGDKISGAKDVGNGWIIGFNQNSGETGILPLTYLKAVEPTGFRRTVRRGFNTVFSRSRRGDEGMRNEKVEEDNEEEAEKTAVPMDDLYENVKVAEGRKENLDIISEEHVPDKDEQKNGARLGRLTLLGQHAFRSARGEHRALKAVLGFVFGVLLGGLITVLLFYSYHYTWEVAGIIGGTVTLLLCLGLAVSVHFRCMVALTLPGVFTARGRATLLSVIAAMMLTGPITNITLNSQEAATSMACVAELAYNQSLALRGQLQEPVIQLRRSLEQSRERLQGNFQAVQSVIDNVTSAIASVENGVMSVNRFLQNAANECSRSLRQARNECSGAFTRTKTDCENTLSRFDPKMSIERAFSSWGIGRRKRDASLSQVSAIAAIVKLKRVKRAGLMDICKLFEVGRVCDALQGEVLCKPVDVSSQLVKGLGDLTSRFNEFIKEITDYSITGTAGAGGSSQASATPQQIVSNVRGEIQGSLDTAMFVIDVISKVLSAMMLLMFLQSAVYLRNYLAKVTFDNIYISRKFRALDEAWSKSGQPAVLPLRKRETHTYVSSFSVSMSPGERRKSLLGLLTVVLLMLQFAMSVVFDFVLYYVLYLIRKHGSLEYTLTGQASVMFSIGGSGLMARLARVFLEGLNVDATYSNILNITTCLPTPTPPNPHVIYTNIALFLVAILCVLLQAYGLRLRHWIVAYYYPEQDEVRIAYLHREILLKRKSAAREAKERLTSGDQGQGQEEDKAGPLDKLASKASCCRTLCPCLKHKVYRCQNCDEAASTVRRCQGSGCSVLLCEDCMDTDSGLCPVCHSEPRDGKGGSK